jgi:ribonucleotide reductase alpha subunit
MYKLEDLKKNEEAPQWLTDPGLNKLQNGYLLEGETPRQMYRRVADAAASRLKKPELSDKFYDYINRNWICLATPIASNMGTTKGLPISCYGSYVADSLKEISLHWQEMSMLTKNGGGIGVTFDLRPKGSPISGGGKSDGIIPWIKVDESIIRSVSQSNTRRGSEAIYYPIEGDEIEEFLDIRRETGDPARRTSSTGLNHAVTIGDEFMSDVKKNKKKWKDIWKKTLNTGYETGEPYLMFRDTANRLAPAAYKKHNLKIVTSQLCLSGDTEILTSQGPERIDRLVGKSVKIWDGLEWVENDSFQLTCKETDLLKIAFRDGSSVKCTPYHKFFIEGREIQASDLKPEDLLDSGSLEAPGEVLSVEKLEEKESVYCTNVESTHKFLLANGVMSGNCNEIYLPCDEEHTFVCCLSSLNAARYEEWKDSDLVETAIWFLDGVMEEFIQKAKGMLGFEKAVRFSEKARALGLGILGWHTLLQSKMIPFESYQAMQLNNELWTLINEKAWKASRDLAAEYGEVTWTKGLGVRNTNLLACAPTKSNALISGMLSEGIEPLVGNIFVQNASEGTFIRGNKHLEELLDALGKNTDEVWSQINLDKGSVKNLDFLTLEQKQVFATAREINQYAIVRQAAQRQKYIDQGQSMNLFLSVPEKPSPEERKQIAKHIYDLHMEIYDLGLKGRYYIHTESGLKGEYRDSCQSCQG